MEMPTVHQNEKKNSEPHYTLVQADLAFFTSSSSSLISRFLRRKEGAEEEEEEERDGEAGRRVQGPEIKYHVGYLRVGFFRKLRHLGLMYQVQFPVFKYSFCKLKIFAFGTHLTKLFYIYCSDTGQGGSGDQIHPEPQPAREGEDQSGVQNYILPSEVVTSNMSN